MLRRQFLGSSLGSLAALGWSKQLWSLSNFIGEPFSLGIASGDVSQSSVILWTRIAPEPEQADGGLGGLSVLVRWELAADPRMKIVLQRGEQLAVPELGHSIHVDLQRLEEGRDYWYRFYCNGQASEVGHTRTLIGEAAKSVRFVTTSCQNYTHGYFGAYHQMVQDSPDFVIHLGDYIYDTSFGESFRRHESESAPRSIDDFRRRHALYKTDPHLQQAHAQLPFFTIIDNHDAIEDNDPNLYQVRSAAYKAWYEHMPVRGYDPIRPNSFDLRRRLQVGRLAQICLLDTRQFRDKKELCRDDMESSVGFGNYRERCNEIFESARSMLGEDQEAWLFDALEQNTTAWNVVASSGPLVPFRVYANQTELGYIGAWDAYPANRNRLAQSLGRAKQGHPIILSGDVHSFWVMDGEKVLDSYDQVPAVEFVSSSISANWPDALGKPIKENLKKNPQVLFYEGNERGYLLHDIDTEFWKTRFRAVGDARVSDTVARDLRVYRVRHGHPGVEVI